MIISIKKDGLLVKQVTVTNKPMILGRASTADVQLLDPMISRHHIRIINNGSSVTFEDMSSRNGMFFKGEKVKIKEVYAGQTIFVGTYVISVSAVNVSDAKTFAFIDDEDAKTEVSMTPDDLEEMALEPTQAPSTNPLFAANTDEHQDPDLQSDAKTNDPLPENAPSSSSPPPSQEGSDSLMEAISVTNEPATFEDPDPEEPAPTIEQQNHIKSDNPALSTITDAPLADEIQSDQSSSFSSSPDEAEPLTSSETDTAEGSTSTTRKLPKEDVKDAEGQELKAETDEGQSSKTEEDDQNPSSSFVFSSLQSEPNIQEPSARDIFQEKASEEDPEHMRETGAFDPTAASSNKPSNESSRTEIRDFAKKDPVKESAPKLQRHKKFMFIGSAILIGILMLLLDKDVQHALFSSDTARSPKTAKIDQKANEQSRIVQFNIEEIKKYLEVEDLDQAQEKMNILLTEHADHPLLTEFLPTYKVQKAALEEKISAQAQQAQEKKDNIKKLFSQSEKLIDDQKYSAAIETLQKIREIDPENQVSLVEIERVESLKIQKERKDFAKKRTYQQLDRIYNEGVQTYEAGDFGASKELFLQVVEERGHPKYKASTNFLKKIANQTDDKLKARIDAAQEKVASLATLPEGYQELSRITKQFPVHKEAKAAFTKAAEMMDRRARELYAEAIAQEELAGDFSSALDLYHEVLIYAPDPNSSYHKKARAKIERLEL